MDMDYSELLAEHNKLLHKYNDLAEGLNERSEKILLASQFVRLRLQFLNKEFKNMGVFSLRKFKKNSEEFDTLCRWGEFILSLV